MAAYLVYLESDGRILWAVACPPEMAAAQAFDGRGVIEGEYVPGIYVAGDPPALTAREPLPVTRDALSFSAPPGTAWRIQEGALGIDEAGVDDDGELALVIDEPGTYVLTLSLWPYLDHIEEIAA